MKGTKRTAAERRMTKCDEEINVLRPDLISLLWSIRMWETYNGKVQGAVGFESLFNI